MTGAVYWTVWSALLLFAAREAGRRRGYAGRSPAPWAWWAFVAGAVLCAIHIVVAMWVSHGWSHAASIAATARQTKAVYDLDWGGGVYVNYAFVAAWLFEAWRWRRRSPRDTGRLDIGTWTMRTFFLVIILNGAVIFAAGTRRVAGVLLVAWLLWIWRPASPAPGSHACSRLSR